MAGERTHWSSLDVSAWNGGLADVEFRHFAALKAVGAARSFRVAADNLGYVQSAVSHQIAALERSVGARLVDRQRGTQPVSLTAAGQLLLEHSEIVLRHMAAAQERLVALSEGRAGTLRIGTFQSVSVHIVPRVRSAFSQVCPGFQMAMTEAYTDEPLFRMLEDGKLDLIFAEEPCVDGPFERVIVSEDPWVGLVPDSSPLASLEEPPSLEDVARSPLIGFNSGRGQEAMLAALAARGIEPEFDVQVDLNPTIAPLVAAGLGVAIVPYLTIDPGFSGTTVLELPELPSRKITIAWRRDDEQSDAAARFIEIAQRCSPRFRLTRSPEVRAAGRFKPSPVAPPVS